jgi:NAD(P)-dependent dehydrogenase (short-subunit alcohol dehydrogenase family)
LSGKVAIVTGAAGGIGSAIARRFRAENATVIGVDLKQDGIIEACDVSKRDDVHRLVDGVVARNGRVDILVHAAAALGGSGNVLTVAPEEWARYIDVNLTGSFYMAQAAAKAMVHGRVPGRIVLVGSVNSFAAEAEAVPYVASKGGVRMLAKALAVDLASHGITVNLLAPGAIMVPRNAALFASEPTASVHRTAIPLGGPGLPDHVAAAALYLVDPDASYVTGSELVVDGGVLARVF